MNEITKQRKEQEFQDMLAKAMQNRENLDDFLDHLYLEIGDVRDLNLENRMLLPEWDNPASIPELIVELASNSEYLHFICKYILNIDLLPYQLVIIQTLWNKSLPMLIATRGGAKSYLLAVYTVLRMILHQGCKVTVVGASLRQSMVIFNYVQTIYENAPILREMSGKGDTGKPKRDVHMCHWTLGKSKATFLPLGDGCLSANTIVTYDNCFKYMDNDFPSHDKNIDHQVFESEGEIWSNGKFRLSDEKYYNGIRKTKRIITSKGFEIEGTLNHKLKVLRDSEIQFVEMQDMKVGDKILIDRSKRWHSGINQITKDEAYACGLMVGDGCWTNKYKLGFASKDLELGEALQKGIDSKWYSVACDPVHWRLDGKERVQNWLNKWEMPKTYTKDKHFPKPIMSASKDVMSAFIRGLFDTDGTIQVSSAKGGTSICVSFCNTSERLIKELQYILTHYGIISCLTSRQRPENKNWNRVYELLITGQNVGKFSEEIGFGLKRKQNILTNGLSQQVRKSTIGDIIPDIKEEMIRLALSFKDNPDYSGDLCVGAGTLNSKKNITRERAIKFIERYGKSNNTFIIKLKELINPDIYYDEIKTIEDNECPTYDLHVPDGHEYTANAFYSHNSKIRGQRANYIICDEFATVPKEIFETVVRGFAAVKSDGVHANVAKGYKNKANRIMNPNSGISEKNNLSGQLEGNQIVLAGTAYYQFNHFYKYFQYYHAIITTGGDKSRLNKEFPDMPVPDNIDPTNYAILRIPYDYIPPDMMDETILTQGRATMDPTIFDMEYGVVFPADSEGFYLATALNRATCPVALNGNIIDSNPKLVGNPNKRYVMGIDPASEDDNFTINIIEINDNYRMVVYQWATNRKDFEALKRDPLQPIKEEIKDYNTFVVKHIRSLLRRFNIELICMDSGGGGVSVKELLRDADKFIDDTDQLIYDIDDEDVKGLKGQHILKMIQFASAEWRVNSHHGLRKDIIDLKLLFPKYDASVVEMQSYMEESIGRLFDTLEDNYLEIEQCKQETTLIKHSQTETGVERWDVPKITGLDADEVRKQLKRDRFTSLLLANWAARILTENDYDKPVGLFGGVAADFIGKPISGVPFVGRGAARMKRMPEFNLEEGQVQSFQDGSSRRVFY